MNTRDQIIETAIELIERQGYHATGLNEIVKESGAPKGSLYYYFPEGKEQITTEAIEFAGRLVAARIHEDLEVSDHPAEAVRLFIHHIADHVEASDFCAGGPLQTVALETATTSERLNLACREAYNLLQHSFQAKLASSGYDGESASKLATLITAAVEGGVILSRTFHSGDPLRVVGDLLAETLAAHPHRSALPGESP